MMTRITNVSNHLIKLPMDIEYAEDYKLYPGTTLTFKDFPDYMTKELLKLGDKIELSVTRNRGE